MAKNKAPLRISLGSQDGKHVDIRFSFPVARVGFTVDEALEFCKQMILLASTLEPEKVKQYGLNG